jgi:hypothetical protein
MKKLVLTLVMFASLFGAAIASDGSTKSTNVNYRVEAAFKKEFAGATSVKWDLLRKENIYQAQFLYNNERLNAYFDSEGNLIATGRFVAVANLPLMLRKNIYERFNDYTIREVVEYSTTNETSYLVVVENEKAKLVVQGYVNGATTIFKKEKKNSVAKL